MKTLKRILKSCLMTKGAPTPALTDATIGNPGNTFNNKIGSGWDLTIGSEVRYHVISNLYLLGCVQATTLLDSRTRNSASINRETHW